MEEFLFEILTGNRKTCTLNGFHVDFFILIAACESYKNFLFIIARN